MPFQVAACGWRSILRNLHLPPRANRCGSNLQVVIFFIYFFLSTTHIFDQGHEQVKKTCAKKKSIKKKINKWLKVASGQSWIDDTERLLLLSIFIPRIAPTSTNLSCPRMLRAETCLFAEPRLLFKLKPVWSCNFQTFNCIWWAAIKIQFPLGFSELPLFIALCWETTSRMQQVSDAAHVLQSQSDT